MTTSWLALLEVLLVFGGALAVGLHQLYKLRAEKRRDATPTRDKSSTDPPERG